MQSPKAAVADCFRNFRRDEVFCAPAQDGSRLFTIPPLLQLAHAAGSSCCWDSEGVSQCNAVWLAKTHLPVSGDTEILQRFRIVNKSSTRKSIIEATGWYPKGKKSATPVRAVRVLGSVHLCAPGARFELLGCRRNPSHNNFRQRQHVGKPAGR